VWRDSTWDWVRYLVISEKNFWVVGNRGRYIVVSELWFNTGLVWARDQHEVGESGILMVMVAS
jgi:hypothetical protein